MMGGTGILRDGAWKHENVAILPRNSADIGETGAHAAPSPDPHHQSRPGMLPCTTLTITCATPCHVLQDPPPPSSIGRPMATSPRTPTHTYQSLPPALGRSLLPSPGNGPANVVTSYTSHATTPQ